MKILVTGSREWKDVNVITSTLNMLAARHGRFLLISGGAQGADALAEHWSDMKGYSKLIERPNYKEQFPKKAPLDRNTLMVKYLKEGDLCIGFWDFESPGTKDCLMKAVDKDGVSTFVVTVDRRIFRYADGDKWEQVGKVPG